MIKSTNDINVTNIQEMENIENEKRNFSTKIAGLNAIACNNLKQDGLQLSTALKDSQDALKALDTTSGLQEMLASQMLSIHNMQQLCFAMANRHIANLKSGQYFINAAVKLSNSFTQQAALLAKLQGNIGQRIVVEHVEVHNGGQAVVGSIQGATPVKDSKK